MIINSHHTSYNKREYMPQRISEIDAIIIRLEETASALLARSLQEEAEIVVDHLSKLKSIEPGNHQSKDTQNTDVLIASFVKDFV